MNNIRITITKDQYHNLSKFLTNINFKLDPKSDLAYELKFGFPEDCEFIEIDVPLEQTEETRPYRQNPKRTNTSISKSEVFSRGKYKGSSYGSVKKEDPKYISWMIQNVDNYESVMFI